MYMGVKWLCQFCGKFVMVKNKKIIDQNCRVLSCLKFFLTCLMGWTCCSHSRRVMKLIFCLTSNTNKIALLHGPEVTRVGKPLFYFKSSCWSTICTRLMLLTLLWMKLSFFSSQGLESYAYYKLSVCNFKRRKL